MFKIVYIISLILMIIDKIGPYKLDYFFQLSVGIGWICVWIIHNFRNKKVLRIHKILIKYILPWLGIALWSGLIWVINRPAGFNFSYVSRAISNLILIIVSIINAYIGVFYFGKEIIRLTYIALLSCIALNFVLVIPQYGVGMLIDYLKGVLIGDFKYQSSLWQLAADLEVQGATMTLGMFLCYFITAEDIPPKRKGRLLILTLPFLYIGFKRTVVLAVLVALGLNLLLNTKRVKLNQLINITSSIYCISAFVYIILIKTNLFNVIMSVFGIDTMGRINIYHQVSQFLELSPLYIGVGFGYIGKYLYDSIGFMAHSEILRMYTEIGCIPFIAWIIYNLIYIPKYVNNKLGQKYGRICWIVSVYVYSTYLVENTLVEAAMLYSYVVFGIVGISNIINRANSSNKRLDDGEGRLDR